MSLFRRKPNINIEPKLLKYLEEKGVLKEFSNNCISYYNKNHFIDVRKVYFYSILSAFHWRETPQGARYWGDLHIKFRDKQFKNK